MYTVTHLETLKNRRYSVMIKSEKKMETFNVSEDIMLEFRLVIGKVLSNMDFKKLVVANDRDIVYQKVLHYALYKMRCTKEITDYLNKKMIPLAEHNYYLTKLRKSTVLDDVKFTEIFVRESFEFKGLGPNKIVYELNNKKISKDIYDPFISKIQAKDIENNLNDLFLKKLNSIKNKSIRIATQNIKQFLVTKGYSFEAVDRFVTKSIYLIKERINEEDVLAKDYQVAIKKYKSSENKKQNVISYLLRKGYDYSKIKVILGEDNL
ncbi:MAG: RecX family transcriptional regulator [Tenericutes bacterium]|nr:RecX family transcriptional regulator [Mycoplasmatota bacterium]